MEIFATIIPLKTILFFVFEIIVLWLLIRIIRYLLSLIRKDILQNRLPFYYPLFSSVLWLLFILYILTYLLKSNLLSILVVLLIVLLLLWRILKNWIYGLVFRFLKGDITGAHIEIEEQIGTIDSWGLFQFCIKMNNKKIAYIPYEKSFTSVFVQSRIKTEQHMQYMSLLVKSSFVPEIVERKIREKIGTIPWVIDCNDISFLPTEKEGEVEIKVVYILGENEKNIQVKKQLTNFIRKIVVN